jgi:ABC-type transporter Mla MlaB component
LAHDSLDLLESKVASEVGIVKAMRMVIQPKVEPTGTVRLALAGRMNANALGELRRAIERVRRRRGRVLLDLSEITLVDRPSLAFLTEQTKDEIELINCPAYLESWIKKADR